jgi:hypothetical protein
MWKLWIELYQKLVRCINDYKKAAYLPLMKYCSFTTEGFFQSKDSMAFIELTRSL